MSCENEHNHSHGGHSHSHNGHDDHDHVLPEETYAAQSLNSKIDLPRVTALNLANSKDDLPKLFKDSTNRFSLRPVIKSDADEQLILHIPFLNGSVKLHSMILRTNGGKYCPRTIKLWKNNDSIDFDTAGDSKPAFTLTQPHVGVEYDDGDSDDEAGMPETLESTADFVEHHLPRHVFTGVHVLTLFVESIYGEEDQCRLHSVELRGEFTELSRDPVITLYESAPNPTDHKSVEATQFSMEY